VTRLDELTVKVWIKRGNMQEYQCLIELTLSLRSLQFVGKAVRFLSINRTSQALIANFDIVRKLSSSIATELCFVSPGGWRLYQLHRYANGGHNIKTAKCKCAHESTH